MPNRTASVPSLPAEISLDPPASVSSLSHRTTRPLPVHAGRNNCSHTCRWDTALSRLDAGVNPTPKVASAVNLVLHLSELIDLFAVTWPSDVSEVGGDRGELIEILGGSGQS